MAIAATPCAANGLTNIPALLALLPLGNTCQHHRGRCCFAGIGGDHASQNTEWKIEFGCIGGDTFRGHPIGQSAKKCYVNGDPSLTRASEQSWHNLRNKVAISRRDIADVHTNGHYAFWHVLW